MKKLKHTKTRNLVRVLTDKARLNQATTFHNKMEIKLEIVKRQSGEKK